METRGEENIDIDTVIALMVGRTLDNTYPKKIIARGEKLLEVKNFSRKEFFKNVNFDLYKRNCGVCRTDESGRSRDYASAFSAWTSMTPETCRSPDEYGK